MGRPGGRCASGAFGFGPLGVLGGGGAGSVLELLWAVAGVHKKPSEGTECLTCWVEVCPGCRAGAVDLLLELAQQSPKQATNGFSQPGRPGLLLLEGPPQTPKRATTQLMHPGLGHAIRRGAWGLAPGGSGALSGGLPTSTQ